MGIFNRRKKSANTGEQLTLNQLLWPVVGCAGVAGVVAWRCRG